jgi:chlorobactene glucosyltransferase
LGNAPRPAEHPQVSLLIPARNEERVIGDTVRQLLSQSYAPAEVLVLNDHSEDRTVEVALQAGEGDPRLQVINGAPLPPGWVGKNWACQQLAAGAKGNILVFTDADVIWTPHALERLVGEMALRQSDLQTVWPTQITLTWSERLVVPLMTFVIVGYLPLLAVHHVPWPVFAAAMGQCLAFRRNAYEAVGGHAAVRNSVVEDVAFAKRIKCRGLKLRVADGDRVILCRMYHNWRSVRNGFAKNILAGHGNSVALLILSWIFHWLLWLAPWIWLIVGAFTPMLAWPLWPASLIVLGVGIRALTAAFSHQRIGDAVAMPISTVLMAIIAAQSIYWRVRYGGPRWRGRIAGQTGDGGDPL